jgi:hypothetical protein
MELKLVGDNLSSCFKHVLTPNMPLDDLIFILVEACNGWVNLFFFGSLGKLMEIEKQMAFSGCIFN